MNPGTDVIKKSLITMKMIDRHAYAEAHEKKRGFHFAIAHFELETQRACNAACHDDIVIRHDFWFS